MWSGPAAPLIPRPLLSPPSVWPSSCAAASGVLSRDRTAMGAQLLETGTGLGVAGGGSALLVAMTGRVPSYHDRWGVLLVTATGGTAEHSWVWGLLLVTLGRGWWGVLDTLAGEGLPFALGVLGAETLTLWCMGGSPIRQSFLSQVPGTDGAPVQGHSPRPQAASGRTWGPARSAAPGEDACPRRTALLGSCASPLAGPAACPAREPRADVALRGVRVSSPVPACAGEGRWVCFQTV